VSAGIILLVLADGLQITDEGDIFTR